MRNETEQQDWVTETLADFPAILTAKEAAGILRITTRHLRNLVTRGRIKAVRERESGSSRVKIPKSSLAAFLRSLDVGPGRAA